MNMNINIDITCDSMDSAAKALDSILTKLKAPGANSYGVITHHGTALKWTITNSHRNVKDRGSVSVFDPPAPPTVSKTKRQRSSVL